MALRTGVALLSGLAALLACSAGPAAAQYGMQPLYGYGYQRPYRYPGMSPYRFSPYGGYSPYSPYERDWGYDDDEASRRPATYRTLCVRMCDGYYFPISAAATLGSLSRDVESCRSSCGSEARLFYHPNAGGGVETMVDVTGLAYSSLRTAFLYRKTLVEGCRCRPQPWSQSEIERHRAYAAGVSPAETARTGSLRSGSKPAAQNDAEPSRAGGASPTPADARFVERPQPVARQVEPARPWPSGSGSSGPPTSRYGWPDADRFGR